MSKKHFELAAAMINQLVIDGRLNEAGCCFGLVCLLNDNPRFDKARFKTACGLGEGESK